MLQCDNNFAHVTFRCSVSVSFPHILRMSGDAADTVLVTGASGFIATHVIKQLQEADYRVTHIYEPL